MPLVSVVVPVHNAMPYLPELLESLERQDLERGAFDVIAVDDGSTDGGAAVLDDYARAHAHVRVIHQPHSGAPGRPRNVGLRESRATYVFFADADDLLAPECLRRTVSHAEKAHADVVIPRMVALGARRPPFSGASSTVADVDLLTAFQTLFPQKLYRRQLLVDHDITFPEGRTHLEDGIFNAHAYVHARRISMLGDYDHYVLRAREDGRNFSRERPEPAGYVWAVGEIARIVRDGVRPPEAAHAIILDLYVRKCLDMYSPGRFRHHDERVQRAWMAGHKAFAEQFLGDGLERRLDSPYRERAWFVRHGDRKGLMDHLAGEAAPVVSAMLMNASWSGAGLGVTIDAGVHGRPGLPPQVVGEIRRRDGQGSSGFPLVRVGETPAIGRPGRYQGVLPVSAIEALVPEAYDLYLVAVSGNERYAGRVTWAAGVGVPGERYSLRVRAAARGGSVSIRKHAAASAGLAGGLRLAAGRIARGLGFRRPSA